MGVPGDLNRPSTTSLLEIAGETFRKEFE